MLRKFLLAVALLLAVASGAQAENRLFTLAATGPVQTAQAEQQNSQMIMGYDTLTFVTVTVGAMLGAVIGTEIAVIGLGVYGHPAATLWVAGVTAFVSGAVGGGATANWILESVRSPRPLPLERPSPNAAQAAARR